MEFKEYYKALGVEPTASADEIKKAYRKLARKYHPDVSKEADASARMAEVNEAYAVLSDPEKRAAFDKLAQRRAAGQDFQPPPGWDAGFDFSQAGSPVGDDGDFSEFFNSLFGRAARARQARWCTLRKCAAQINTPRSPSPWPMRTTVRHARLLCAKPASMNPAMWSAPSAYSTCGYRRASRKVRAFVCAARAARDSMAARQAICIMEVEFEPDPRYRVEGRDVTQTVPVAPWEAALGATIEVPTPSGPRRSQRAGRLEQRPQVTTQRTRNSGQSAGRSVS